jgi:CelD/BcsL family acetyltransferase involved in cellulose biosynthesis
LAPCYREPGEGGDRLLPLGVSLSDYLDVLMEPDGHDGIAAAMIEAAPSLPWLTWELEELSAEASALRLLCPGSALASRSMDQSACPVIELRGGADLAGSVPARRRRQLRRALAGAGRRGRTAIIAADHDPARFLDELFRLHAACWEQRGEPGVLDRTPVRKFHREALPALAAHRLARCYLIEIGDTVAGAYYGFADRGRAYAYLGGFDPAFGEQSPGSILIGHAIAEAIREGAGEFHFLRGREPYKYAWGAVDRWNRKRIFSRNASA